MIPVLVIAAGIITYEAVLRHKPSHTSWGEFLDSKYYTCCYGEVLKLKQRI
ncbi:MAG: hypothetical protein LUQ04_06090 [Methanoregula sp.]|nr:hypothetical protein [Methanoregula sp.]